MHIPDGYLSPSTCAVMAAAAAPFWYVALERLKRLMHTRALPLVAAFAAFSFVVMMFNVPVPNGSTAHAVAGTLTAILLGPWAALIAITVALVIQALFTQFTTFPLVIAAYYAGELVWRDRERRVHEILDATIPLWTNDYVAAHGRGAIDQDAWQTSVAFMATQPDSGVTSQIPVEQLVDASLLP